MPTVTVFTAQRMLTIEQKADDSVARSLEAQSDALAAKISADESAFDAENSRLAAEAAEKNTLSPTEDVVRGVLGTEITTPGSQTNNAIDSAVSTANAGITPDGGVRAVGKGEIVYRVKDYGADNPALGDVATAIQTCLDAVSTKGGGTALLTDGVTYQLSTALKPKANVTLAGRATLQLLGTVATYAILIQNVSNVKLSDFTIDLNKSDATTNPNGTSNAGSTANQQGIYISTTVAGMSSVKLSDITVKNGWQRGIAAVASGSGTLTDLTIERCVVKDVGDVRIFVSAPGNADRISPSLSRRVKIKECVVSGTGKGGIQVNGYSFVDVKDNDLDGTGATSGHGICFGTSGTTGHTTDFTCSGNKVRNFIGSGAWGILATNNAKRFSISNNPAVNGNTGGISVDVEDSANLGVLVDVAGVVADNGIKGSVGGTGSHGINARICSNLAIHGNSSCGNAGAGVAVSNAYGCSVNGNALNGNTGAGVAIFGTNAGTGGHAIGSNALNGNTGGKVTTSTPPVACTFATTSSTPPA